MPTPKELVAEVGPPPKGNVFRRDRKARAGVFEELLEALDVYRGATTNRVSDKPHLRAEQAKTLVGYLDRISRTAMRYEGDKTARGARVAGLIAECRTETAVIGAMNRDPAYDAGGNQAWAEEIKDRQFQTGLGRAHRGLRALNAIEQAPREEDDAAQQRDALAQADVQAQSGYLGALGVLKSRPDVITRARLRDLAETLLEANRRAGDAAGIVMPQVNMVALTKELRARVEAIADAHANVVTDKVRDVSRAIEQDNAHFADNELVELTRVDEDIALVCGVVRTSARDVGQEIPRWVEWQAYRSGARVQELVRLYRRVHPGIGLGDLPRALTAPYTLLGPTNPLADWVRPVFREGPRATGEAAQALQDARASAAERADDDYRAALDRLQNELGVDSAEVEEVLRGSLLALSAAPLTVNFSHEKLQLILDSGGFKNYWQVNDTRVDPGPAGSAEDKQKFSYQQERLEAEGRLFGGTRDATEKKLRAAEQAISTGANVTGYHLGSAPTITYGRSVAVLKDSVKQRATYTPWDAIDLVKLINDGQGFVGPEVVATHDNLAAIIRYAPAKAIKSMIDKARNPRMVADGPMENYVEAQIHGPLELRDIDKIIIAIDDLENSAYEELERRGVQRPSDEMVQDELSRLKEAIEATLTAAQIDVDFRTLL